MPYDNLRKFMKNKPQDEHQVDHEPGFSPIESIKALGKKWLDDGPAESMPDPSKQEEGLKPPTLGLDPLDYIGGAAASKLAPKLARAVTNIGSDMIKSAPRIIGNEVGSLGSRGDQIKKIRELIAGKNPQAREKYMEEATGGFVKDAWVNKNEAKLRKFYDDYNMQEKMSFDEFAQLAFDRKKLGQ